MTSLQVAPHCESCGEIVPPWRRAWSRLCDCCDVLSPKKDDDLSPVVLPHIVTAPVTIEVEKPA